MILYCKIYNSNNNDRDVVAISATELSPVRMDVLDTRFKKTASIMTPRTTDGLISLSYSHTWTEISDCGELSPEVSDWLFNDISPWILSKEYPIAMHNNTQKKSRVFINTIELFMDYRFKLTGVSYTLNDRIIDYNSRTIRFNNIKNLMNYE